MNRPYRHLALLGLAGFGGAAFLVIARLAGVDEAWGLVEESGDRTMGPIILASAGVGLVYGGLWAEGRNQLILKGLAGFSLTCALGAVLGLVLDTDHIIAAEKYAALIITFGFLAVILPIGSRIRRRIDRGIKDAPRVVMAHHNQACARVDAEIASNGTYVARRWFGKVVRIEPGVVTTSWFGRTQTYPVAPGNGTLELVEQVVYGATVAYAVVLVIANNPAVPIRLAIGMRPGHHGIKLATTRLTDATHWLIRALGCDATLGVLVAGLET